MGNSRSRKHVRQRADKDEHKPVKEYLQDLLSIFSWIIFSVLLPEASKLMTLKCKEDPRSY